MKIRSICDVRQFPLYLSVVQCVNATIPAFDISGSLFHALLGLNGLGREWGWFMMLSGLYLVWGSLFARRETLHIGLFLSSIVWGCMTVMMSEVWYEEITYLGITQKWITPITLTMPVNLLMCGFCLFRDMIVRPVQIPERRKRERVYG